MIKILAASLLHLSLTGCVTSSGVDIVAFKRQDVVEASIYELLAAPDRFDGRPVQVIGVGSFSFIHEGFSGIYVTTDDFKHQTKGVIELHLLEPHFEKREKELIRLTGKHVLVEGVFHARPVAPEPAEGFKIVCVGTCWGGGYIDQVSRVSLWQK